MTNSVARQAVSPQFSAPAELLLRAQAIKVVFFDVDGVLTDGGLYFSAEGEQLKRFSTLDGHGLKMLQAAGVVPAVVSGRDSAALRTRLAALGVVHMVLGTEDKLPAAEHILKELGLDWSAAAAMGDDWPDLPLLRRAALACVPSSGHVECLALAHWVPQALPGHGAVRELCDVVVLASGHYRGLLERAAR
jgi:3-deoxy-D-manno-octulosonate 8-phosphate phosphatase (KDO 8-P phosphatase)